MLNMKDVVDKVASAELIKRKYAFSSLTIIFLFIFMRFLIKRILISCRIVPDFANAIAMFYSKKTGDRPELVTLRKQIEERIEKMVKNFWWDIHN